MIVDAILRSVYTGNQTLSQVKGDVPDNLKKFFQAKAKKDK